MSRYVNADKMISDTKAMKRIAEGISIEGIIKYLEENSLTDVVEIVRCKNCKWWNRGECAIEINCENDKPSADDFCSYGESIGDKQGLTPSQNLEPKEL